MRGDIRPSMQERGAEPGVTPADILEVLQLLSVTSLRTLDVALPLVTSIFPADEGQRAVG